MLRKFYEDCTDIKTFGRFKNVRVNKKSGDIQYFIISLDKM